MQKTARKPSSDPVQEKLRQTKDAWNKEVKLFIDDLINFKKMMNGMPSKFFKEKSKIVNPIPSNPANIVSGLVNKFNEIANEGNGIVQEQINYSKTRRQPKPKGEVKPTTTPATPILPSTPPANLTQQLTQGLSAADENYLLVSEGSNILTRFWTKLLNPGFGSSPEAVTRRYRTSSLMAAANLSKSLNKLQAAVVKSGKDNVSEVVDLIDSIVVGMNSLEEGMKAYLKQSNPAEYQKDIADKQIAKDPLIVQVYNILKDFKNKDSIDPVLLASAKATVTSLHKKLLAFQSTKSFDDQKRLAMDIVPLYSGLLVELSSKKGVTKANSLEELAKMPVAAPIVTPTPAEAPIESIPDAVTTASPAVNDLQSVAQNFFKKILDKTMHQAWSDPTSANRLYMYKKIGEARNLTNQLMNTIEGDLDTGKIKSLLKDISSKVIDVKDSFAKLSPEAKEAINMLEIRRIQNKSYVAEQDSKYIKNMYLRHQMSDLKKKPGK